MTCMDTRCVCVCVVIHRKGGGACTGREWGMHREGGRVGGIHREGGRRACFTRDAQ